MERCWENSVAESVSVFVKEPSFFISGGEGNLYVSMHLVARHRQPSLGERGEE